MLPPGEKIIEKKKCRLSGQEFVVTDKDLEFYDKISPVFAGKKYLIPSPTLCPDERSMRRLSRRNEKSLYKRRCDKTGQEIISSFPMESTFPVYAQEVWQGDSWSPYVFGRVFDFSRTAFDQFLDLQNVVPHIALENVANENSPYVNHSAWNKDCHLIFYSDQNQDCMYLNNSFHNKRCFDSSYIMRCENSYGCYNCFDSYRLFFSRDCHGCRDSFFLESCSGCHDCFGCVGLHNKSFCLFGEALSEQEYNKKISELRLQTDDHIQRVQQIIQQKNAHIPHRYMMGIKNENSFGDALSECHNVWQGYYVEKSDNCRYIQDSQRCRDCMDMSGWGGTGAELVYESISVGDGSYNALFSSTIWGGQKNAFYSEWCGAGEDCLLSFAIKKGQHVILNKSYSKREYEELVPRIINHMISTGEWGEFFPISISPFCYNETTAHDYYPLTQEEVSLRGGRWKHEGADHGGKNIAAPLPIREYLESEIGYAVAQKNIENILSQTLVCKQTGKPYQITKQELLFYLENHLPIPTRHYEQRHKDRLAHQNSRTLHHRICSTCQKELLSPYSPTRPEKILCEECYKKAVY